MTKQRKTKIYLAGPMRGYKDFNFPAFHKAAKELRAKGYEVFSPAENDIEVDGFDPTKDKPKTFRHYMHHDLPAVCESDGVIVLDGWEKSQGACLEVHVARAVGLPVHDMRQQPVVNSPTVLQEANDLIYGERNAAYGPPNQDFQRTADMWTGLFQYKLKEGERFRPQDVAYFMIALKLSRAQHSDKRDNAVDIAGYAGCSWRCIEGK